MKARVTVQLPDGSYNNNGKNQFITAEFKSRKNLVKFNKNKKTQSKFEIFNGTDMTGEPDIIVFA